MGDIRNARVANTFTSAISTINLPPRPSKGSSWLWILRFLGIVWAETSRLVPADGSAAAKARLQAVVGRLAEQAGRRRSTANFARLVSLPSVETPGGDRADDMRNAVDAALTTDQSAGVRLPRWTVLWEVTGTGEPRETDLPLPTGATWIKEGSATRTSDFTVEGDRSRRLFRLYESDAEPGIDDTAYVSGLTYSGVPTGSSKINYLSLPWVVGIGAAIMFFWMIATLAWTGGSVNQANLDKSANRMSLARMQVTLWTIVVLGAYYAIASFNIGMLAEPFVTQPPEIPIKFPQPWSPSPAYPR